MQNMWDGSLKEACRVSTLGGQLTPTSRQPQSVCTDSTALEQPALATHCIGAIAKNVNSRCVHRRCDEEGRVVGGVGALPGLGWWPIKAYKPCDNLTQAGLEYTRCAWRPLTI